MAPPIGGYPGSLQSPPREGTPPRLIHTWPVSVVSGCDGGKAGSVMAKELATLSVHQPFAPLSSVCCGADTKRSPVLSHQGPLSDRWLGRRGCSIDGWLIECPHCIGGKGGFGGCRRVQRRVCNGWVVSVSRCRNGLRSPVVEVVSGGRLPVRGCSVCGYRSGMRDGSKYCSNACRQRAYRRRKKHQVERQRCIL